MAVNENAEDQPESSTTHSASAGKAEAAGPASDDKGAEDNSRLFLSILFTWKKVDSTNLQIRMQHLSGCGSGRGDQHVRPFILVRGVDDKYRCLQGNIVAGHAFTSG